MVTLSGNLPALYNLKTLGVIPFHSQTTSLTLTGLSNVSDVSVADALRKMPNLEHLNLRCVFLAPPCSLRVLEHRGSADLDGPSRALCSVGSGSTLVSQKTALALQSAAGGLRSLNLSETAIRVPDLQPLLLAAQRLGTLKLANIKGVVRSRFLLRSPSFATRGTDGARGDQLPQTDPALGKLLDVLYADVGPSRKGPSVAAVRPLAALKTLKLRGNVRSGCSISALRAAGARD